MEMWEKWISSEDMYIARDKPKEFADIVVDGTKDFEVQIKELTNFYLRSSL